jgi:hypothetical protein
MFKCDQVKIKTLYTYCARVGRRGKGYETKQTTKVASHPPYIPWAGFMLTGKHTGTL